MAKKRVQKQGQPGGDTASERLTEIGGRDERLEALLKAYSTEFIVNSLIMGAFRFKDTIYQRYGLNRCEVWLLLALCGFLMMRDKQIVSKEVFFDYLTGNFKKRAKFEGYMTGLLKHGCVGLFEYIRVPGSVSVGLSDYGLVIIRAYNAEMMELLKKHIPQEAKEIPIPISYEEDIPRNWRKLA